MNRKLVSAIADLHFAPTAEARDNLLRENIDPARILVTGNTIIDALLEALALLDADQPRLAALEAALPHLDPSKRLILATCHRRDNCAGGLGRVALGLRRLADRGDVEVVYPVHLNPEVQRTAHEVLGGHPAIHLTDPLDYLPFIHLMRRSTLIVTDSGGVQE